MYMSLTSILYAQVIHQFYQDFTGQPLEKIQEETDRDNFLSPQQAMELGLIDGII